MTILVTGGAGFIGSNFTEMVAPHETVVVLDKLTYAGNKTNLKDIPHVFYHGDINDTQLVISILQRHLCRGIINFAAETHVDNSITNATPFIRTNIDGTASLLEATLWHKNNNNRAIRFHQISTDEVYGSLGFKEPAFTEQTPYNPQSPYAASKAAADHLVRSYGNTYKLDYVITNCSNNFGPKQHPEKLIPKTILNAMKDLPIPMYGQGINVRDWIYVKDHCQAIFKIFNYSPPYHSYNIGTRNEMNNKTVIELILDIMEKPHSLITSVEDRPGHDLRYAIDATKLEQNFPIRRAHLYDDLVYTIDWYKKNYHAGNY